VCLLAVGDRVAAACEAADLLGADGVAAAVWDVRSVRPADAGMLAAAAEAPLVVTVENGLVGGGAGAELADRITELVGVRHAPPVLRLGVPAAYLPQGKPARILAELGLDGPGVAAATRKALTDER
jgi:transketolase C-terminal domain/subunit